MPNAQPNVNLFIHLMRNLHEGVGKQHSCGKIKKQVAQGGGG